MSCNDFLKDTPITFSELKSLLSAKQKPKKPKFTLDLQGNSTYNALTDKHLLNYFENARRRNHLLQMRLINKLGQVLEKPMTDDMQAGLRFNRLKRLPSKRNSGPEAYSRTCRKLCAQRLKPSAQSMLPEIGKECKDVESKAVMKLSNKRAETKEEINKSLSPLKSRVQPLSSPEFKRILEKYKVQSLLRKPLKFKYQLNTTSSYSCLNNGECAR